MVSYSEVVTGTTTLSIGCSLVAGLYQMYLGYLYEGADGFDPMALLGWLLGDTFNVIGTFWAEQLTFQKVIAIVGLINVLGMSAQHIYYENKHKRVVRIPDPVDMGSGRGLAMRWGFLLRPYIFFSLFKTVRAHSTVIGSTLLGSTTFGSSTDYKYIVGQCFAWLAESSYCLALIPQAISNFRRKSTGSVSIVLFLADGIASLSYFGTVLVSAFEKQTEHERATFLLDELAYLLGTASCALLDCVLLSQYYLYPQFVVELPVEEDIPYVFSRDTTPLQPFRSWHDRPI